MGAFSNYLEDKLVDHVLGVTPYTPPVTRYVALHSADPTEAGSVGEISGGSYARQVAAFAASSAGATANQAAITYASMPACTVTHISIKDALTAGNTLFYGPLVTPKTVNAGDTFTIAAGDLDVALD